MNQFLTQSELTINKANYLTGNKSMPVTNEGYVAAQNKAHFVVTLAAAVKGKNFKTGKVDNLDTIIREVMAGINNTKQSYGTAPVKPAMPTKSALADEALAFDQFKTDEVKFSQLNEVMQEFNSIQGVESVGDYFSEGVVKLSAIYEIATIQAAVVSIIDTLGSVPSL